MPERLVEVRERFGYTRKRLSEELKIPYRTITNYENGEREPGHSYLVVIAQKFGVTTDYILGVSQSMLPEQKNAPSLSDEAKHLLDVYGRLDAHGRRMVEVVAAEEQARLDSAGRPAALKASAPPPLQLAQSEPEPTFCAVPAGVAAPEPEPDYRAMPFAAHGPVEEALTEEQLDAVERFHREVARRERKKGKP